MIKEIKDVENFHKAFNLPINEVNDKVKELRCKLIAEEAREVIDAINNEPVEDIAKEICDLLYVTFGAIVEYGLQDKIEECFAEVQRSNLSKLDENGKPIYREDGKVIKSHLYSPANIKSILCGL
jgi:predicted HAD superfamily Cof-like phosphohydrolase